MRATNKQDSITTGAGQYTQRNADSVNRNTNGGAGGDPDSRYSSWDRRSQTSSGGHRYYSISSNTLGGGGGGGGDPRGSPIPEDPPKILQYARPPENLTSPNRESTTDHSLTHSPDLEKKVEKERRSLERRQQQQQGSNKAPKRGDTSSPSAKSSVISSLRNSFRTRSRSRKTSAPVPISSPASPSDGPPSIHLPTRKLSSASAKEHGGGGPGGGRYTPTSRSGSVNSFRGNTASWSVAARNTTTTQLLPGRAASPGRPVQVVAPFIPEEGNPESAEMRDPTLLQQQRLNHNNNNPVMETAARTSAAAPTAPVRQQRCLPQTPKQASRTGLTGAASAGGSGGGRATAKVSAVVSPVQHAAAAAPSSTAAPRPAQRLSLRHKVGQWSPTRIGEGKNDIG